MQVASLALHNISHLSPSLLRPRCNSKEEWQMANDYAPLCMIAVHCADRDLLGMHWHEQYYVDTCLLFGLHLAPFLFNEYAMTIKWIMTHNHQLCQPIHYLDDFCWLPFTNPSATNVTWTHFSR